MSSELTTTTQSRELQRAEDPLSPAELIHQVRLIQEVMRDVMKEGEHWGKIPGCGPKPALFKAGAEKLQLTFRLHPDFDVHETDVGAGQKTFRVTCRMQNASGGFQGAGVGYGSTRESKYSHKGGKETNPADYYNTVLKMAKKRAQVDAILTCTAASDIFTQDLEDMPRDMPRDHFIANKFPASQENDRGIPPSSEPGARVSDPAPPESPIYWTGVIKQVTHVPKKPNWKSRLHWIEMENGESAGTWEETLAADAEIVAGQGEVRVKVQRSKRDASKFEYLGFEPIEESKDTQQRAEELPWQ